MNRTQMMITPAIRASMINTLNEQSPPELQDSWLTDRFMHNTFVSDLVPGIGIDAKEIMGKTDYEIKMLIERRITFTLRKES